MNAEMLLMNAGSGVTPAAFQAAMQVDDVEARGGAAAGSAAGTDPSFAESDQDGSDSDAASVMTAPKAPPANRGSPRRYAPAQAPRAPGPSAAQTAAMKGDLLFKLDRLAKRGLRPPRPMTVDDSLADITVEYERLDREAKVDRAVEFQRSALVTFANGVEMLTAHFNPVGLKLDGWSGSVSESINSYDDVFQQLGEKYGMGTSSMPPEFTLLMMVASSGFMFHMQATMFKQAPELDEVMRDDPELAQHIAAATARMMKKREAARGGSGGGGMASFMSAMMGGGGGGGPAAGSAPVRGPATDDVDEYIRKRAEEVALFSDDSDVEDDDEDDVDSVLNEVNAAVRSGRSLVIDA